MLDTNTLSLTYTLTQKIMREREIEVKEVEERIVKFSGNKLVTKFNLIPKHKQKLNYLKELLLK
jgi:hypothetical protein